MKKILFLSVMFMFSLIASAQQGGGRGGFGMMNDEAYADMKAKVGLDDQQLEKIKAIYTESSTKMRAEMEKIGDDREKMMELMTKANTERDDSIKKLLSDDQAKKYQAWSDERRQRRPGGGGGGGR